LDHYEVLEVVGRGGMGVVLKARDTKLQRVVAIKVLALRLAGDAAARQQFVREAQAAAAVRDDHVIDIHAVSDDGPVPYLVMEYIAGLTLEQQVKQHGALELKQVLRIGMQMARGLAAAHAQGLVHRDIKPGNVLLENGVQRVKITDFGLACADDLGRPGVLAGTPLFMSPEQARGEPIDHRTDLFSLGSVLYTLCTGRPPFRADRTLDVLKRVCEDNPRPIRESNPDVPLWLCDVIGKLHAKKARDRFTSAQEVADVLGRQLARLQEPLRTPPPVPAAPVQSVPAKGGARSSRRRRLVLGVCLVGLIAVGALVVYLKQKPLETTGPAAPVELRREDIPASLLALAGGGDPEQAPSELAAVLGDGRFLLPRVGQTAWMDQSPDGMVLAVPLDEDVLLFAAPTGTYLRRLKGPGGRVFAVTFSRDNQLLAASTRYEEAGGSVRVWDLSADRVLFTNPQPGPTISCAVAFSADGERLFTEGDGRIHVWDTRFGRHVQQVELNSKGIAALSVSPDGRRLAVATWLGNQVKIYTWAGDQLAETHTLGHPSPVTSAAFSPDGKFLASGDTTGFKLWDAETFQEIRTVPAEAEQLTFAPDRRTLLAATTTGNAKAAYTFTRWDVVTRKALPPLAVEVSVNPVRAFHRLSRDGKVLFVAPQHDATYVREIDTATGKELFPHQGHVAPLNVVAVSPDGRTVASAGEDWAVKLWDLATGRVLHSLTAHTGAVCGLAFSPDGRRLASGSRDGTIALWDVAGGTEVRALHWHSRSFSRIQFSPDGRTLAAGDEGGLVKFWDVADGKAGRPLHGHAGAVRCVAFSPDGTRLASGGEDRTVRVHDLATGRVQTFKTPNAVNQVAFSPDGRTLAAVGDAPDPAVLLWDLETGQATTRPGDKGHLLGVAFSPSAPLLATCGEDGTVALWDLTGGVRRVRTIGPGPFGGGVRSVAFTPDGRYLATANANGTVYLLRVPAPEVR
jgi:WD40 repeat protein/tRNA A-37 threonylcarbamoyl transferase component Bud32